ncbi:hypothetical protein P7C70_g5086, partial [Phenoliferia sp. Uapishka_3]
MTSRTPSEQTEVEDRSSPAWVAKGQSGGGTSAGTPMETVSLFDPRLKEERKTFVKTMGLRLPAAFAPSILGYLTSCIVQTPELTFDIAGGYFRQAENLYRLKIGLIDLDTPACAVDGCTPTVGPSLIAASKAQTGFHLGWEVLDSETFDLSLGIGGSQRGVDAFEWAVNAVLQEDYYGIIIGMTFKSVRRGLYRASLFFFAANANATTSPLNLINAALAGSTTATPYIGTGAITIISTEARNFDTYDQWIMPGMAALSTTTLPLAASAFAKVVYARLGALTAAQYSALNHDYISSLVTMPFGAWVESTSCKGVKAGTDHVSRRRSTYNIRPLDAFAGIAATTIGMVYLLIFTFFISLFWNAARGPIEAKIPLKQLILLRVFVPVVQYLFISLSISLLSMAFGVPFNRFYGKGGFVIFWLSNFIAQWALGMPMEMALSLLGPRFSPFFLIFWVITNISVAFFDFGDQAHFYSYGFALPVFNAVDAAKSIAFGSKNHLGQNFGINIAWAVVGSLLLAAVTACKRAELIKSKQRVPRSKAS